jgi:hypothetical protein
MSKMGKLLGCLICAGILLGGCVSKGFILDEINKSKANIDSEQAKKLDETTTKISSDLSKRMLTLETEYVSKNFLQSELYNNEQKIMKEVDTRVDNAKKLVDEVHQKMETFKMANQGDIEKMSQDLNVLMDSLFRNLNAQKEGLERAMGEIEKLSLPKSAVKPIVEPSVKEEDGK